MFVDHTTWTPEAVCLLDFNFTHDDLQDILLLRAVAEHGKVWTKK